MLWSIHSSFLWTSTAFACGLPQLLPVDFHIHNSCCWWTIDLAAMVLPQPSQFQLAEAIR